MFTFNKSSGLQKANSKPEGSIQIDTMSDLHLDFYITKENVTQQIKSFIELAVKQMKVKTGEVLIVGGDISHDNSITLEFLNELSKNWNCVLVIPGNHDWYFQNKDEDRYAELIEMTNNRNIYFLMDEIEIFEYEEIKIAGTSMLYDLNETVDYVMWKSILNDRRFMSRNFVNKRNKADVEYYNKVINDVDIFVSHVPIVNLDGDAVTKNLFLNMNVSPQKDVLYIAGHTHFRRNSVDVDSEFNALNISYGYPSETSDKRNIITPIFIN